jgi:hypothetical protein
MIGKTPETGDRRVFGGMTRVIAPDRNEEPMTGKSVAMITILLLTAVILAGCTGSPAAPAPTPALTPEAVTTAAGGTVVPVVSYAAVTLETPYQGHPYSKTFSFSGTGDYEDFTFTTDNDATWAFRMDPGPGNFRVSLKDARGTEIMVLADGPGAGTASVRLKAGNYYFDIMADSPWHITMSMA